MQTEHARPAISVLLVVAVRLYREGLEAILGAQHQLHVSGSVATMLDAHSLMRTTHPDVLIIDVSLPDVCRAIREIVREAPRPRVLAFAVREDIGTILDYANAGAEGFVTANGSVAELVQAIERTAAGELLCSPRIAAQLLRRAAHAEPTSDTAPGPSLTIREHQVFSLLKQGLSNKEIASSLRIAEATVKNHVHRVLEKLQVTSRAQAAAAGTFLLSPPR